MEYQINENSGPDSNNFQNEPTTTDFQRSKIDLPPGQNDTNPVTNRKEFIESDSNRSLDSSRRYISQKFDESNYEEEEDKYDFED